jgi:hypothetical protein
MGGIRMRGVRMSLILSLSLDRFIQFLSHFLKLNSPPLHAIHHVDEVGHLFLLGLLILSEFSLECILFFDGGLQIRLIFFDLQFDIG